MLILFTTVSCTNRNDKYLNFNIFIIVYGHALVVTEKMLLLTFEACNLPSIAIIVIIRRNEMYLNKIRIIPGALR